ncbi:hypothetical protein GGI17_001395 [Coemansia sp. S146]|nr:hypothetical protein GGI17_001395 [Coemansia sp. S146]
MHPYRDLTPLEYNITFIPRSNDVKDTKRKLMVGTEVQVHKCPYETIIRDLVENIHDFNGIQSNTLKFQYFSTDVKISINSTVGAVAMAARKTESYVHVHLGGLDNRWTIIVTYVKKDADDDDDDDK